MENHPSMSRRQLTPGESRFKGARPFQRQDTAQKSISSYFSTKISTTRRGKTTTQDVSARPADLTITSDLLERLQSIQLTVDGMIIQLLQPTPIATSSNIRELLKPADLQMLIEYSHLFQYQTSQGIDPTKTDLHSFLTKSRLQILSLSETSSKYAKLPNTTDEMMMMPHQQQKITSSSTICTSLFAIIQHSYTLLNPSHSTTAPTELSDITLNEYYFGNLDECPYNQGKVLQLYKKMASTYVLLSEGCPPIPLFITSSTTGLMQLTGTYDRSTRLTLEEVEEYIRNRKITVYSLSKANAISQVWHPLVLRNCEIEFPTNEDNFKYLLRDLLGKLAAVLVSHADSVGYVAGLSSGPEVLKSPGDGDCLFHTVIASTGSRFPYNSVTLRTKTCKHILENSDQFIEFLTYNTDEMSLTTNRYDMLKAEVDHCSVQGIYNNSIGDVLVHAIADLLGLVIVVHSNADARPERESYQVIHPVTSTPLLRIHVLRQGDHYDRLAVQRNLLTATSDTATNSTLPRPSNDGFTETIRPSNESEEEKMPYGVNFEGQHPLSLSDALTVSDIPIGFLDVTDCLQLLREAIAFWQLDEELLEELTLETLAESNISRYNDGRYAFVRLPLRRSISITDGQPSIDGKAWPPLLIHRTSRTFREIPFFSFLRSFVGFRPRLHALFSTIKTPSITDTPPQQPDISSMKNFVTLGHVRGISEIENCFQGLRFNRTSFLNKIPCVYIPNTAGTDKFSDRATPAAAFPDKRILIFTGLQRATRVSDFVAALMQLKHLSPTHIQHINWIDNFDPRLTPLPERSLSNTSSIVITLTETASKNMHSFPDSTLAPLASFAQEGELVACHSSYSYPLKSDKSEETIARNRERILAEKKPPHANDPSFPPLSIGQNHPTQKPAGGTPHKSSGLQQGVSFKDSLSGLQSQQAPTGSKRPSAPKATSPDMVNLAILEKMKEMEKRLQELESVNAKLAAENLQLRSAISSSSKQHVPYRPSPLPAYSEDSRSSAPLTRPPSMNNNIPPSIARNMQQENDQNQQRMIRLMRDTVLAMLNELHILPPSGSQSLEQHHSSKSLYMSPVRKKLRAAEARNENGTAGNDATAAGNDAIIEDEDYNANLANEDELSESYFAQATPPTQYDSAMPSSDVLHTADAAYPSAGGIIHPQHTHYPYNNRSY
eukprot:gene25601-30917_t